mmetsp:Transcript_35313/g.74591  ORF Transcript_35313/g.74591 Transcript_35313/m.74591 type:complete len:293 (-) Transcript_35313:767-1645(-)
MSERACDFRIASGTTMRIPRKTPIRVVDDDYWNGRSMFGLSSRRAFDDCLCRHRRPDPHEGQAAPSRNSHHPKRSHHLGQLPCLRRLTIPNFSNFDCHHHHYCHYRCCHHHHRQCHRGQECPSAFPRKWPMLRKLWSFVLADGQLWHANPPYSQCSRWPHRSMLHHRCSHPLQICRCRCQYLRRVGACPSTFSRTWPTLRKRWSFDHDDGRLWLRLHRWHHSRIPAAPGGPGASAANSPGPSTRPAIPSMPNPPPRPACPPTSSPPKFPTRPIPRKSDGAARRSWTGRRRAP